MATTSMTSSPAPPSSQQPTPSSRLKRSTKPTLSPTTTREDWLRRDGTVISADGRSDREKGTPVPAKDHDAAVSSAALEFDFSFIGEDGDVSMANVSDEQRQYLHGYLQDRFDIWALDYCDPFLVIHCVGEAPDIGARPFSIAGLIAIWRNEDDGPFDYYLGEMGEGQVVEIDEAILAELHPRSIPNDDVILYLANQVFRDSQALSIMWDSLVIELPKTDHDEFVKRLGEMPRALARCSLWLQYHNGPLPGTEARARAIQPDPTDLGALVDDKTDYVKQRGKFSPGAMLSSLDDHGNIDSMVTAGVLVEKGQARRLVTAFQNWEDRNNNNPSILGGTDPTSQRIFRACQGEHADGKPGTAVGFLQERLGGTGIGLVQLHDESLFTNQFMDINAQAKRLVPFKEQKFGDQYCINSFVAGAQMLRLYGVRFPLVRRRRTPGDPDLFVSAGPLAMVPSGDVAYLQPCQGAFATNAPKIATQPQIRAGLCGSMIVRCDRRAGETMEETLGHGDICGMVHYADLQRKYATTRDMFLIYADALDPVINDGWSIVPVEDDASDGSDGNGVKDGKGGSDAGNDDDEGGEDVKKETDGKRKRDGGEELDMGSKRQKTA